MPNPIVRAWRWTARKFGEALDAIALVDIENDPAAWPSRTLPDEETQRLKNQLADSRSEVARLTAELCQQSRDLTAYSESGDWLRRRNGELNQHNARLLTSLTTAQKDLSESNRRCAEARIEVREFTYRIAELETILASHGISPEPPCYEPPPNSPESSPSSGSSSP